LKETLSEAQRQLVTAKSQFDNLRRHAEAQLAQANERIEGQERGMARQRALLTTKLTKCQAKLTTMTKEVEVRKAEVERLSKIVEDMFESLEKK